MGFRNGAYATVWSVQPKTEAVTVLNISTSKKPKGSDQYITDFSGFCSCLGATVATAAKALKRGDKIKLGDVETTTTYVEATKKTYTNHAIFSFEKAEKQPAQQPKQEVDSPDFADIPDGVEEEGLPF